MKAKNQAQLQHGSLQYENQSTVSTSYANL